MDQFIEEQEKDTRAQVDALIAENQDILQKTIVAHDRKLNDLKLELKTSERKAQQRHVALTDQYEQLRNDYDLLSLAYQGIKNERDQLQQKVTYLLHTRSNNNDDIASASKSDYGNNSLDKKQQEGQQDHDDNGRVITMAQQHQNELELLYNQYQQLLDRKDHELEDYGSRLQTLTMEQQKALASCRMELGDRISSLENQVDSYEATIQSSNQTMTALQSRLKLMEQQKQKDQQTIHTLMEEKMVLENQLDQRRIHNANHQPD